MFVLIEFFPVVHWQDFQVDKVLAKYLLDRTCSPALVKLADALLNTLFWYFVSSHHCTTIYSRQI